MKTRSAARSYAQLVAFVRVLALIALLLSNVISAAPLPAIAAENATQADASQSQAPGAPSITATKTDALATDNDSDGRADPGDTLHYTVGVSNTGTTDATGLVISDTLDPNTSLVPGSVRVSPLAIADSYNALGNTPLTIAAPGLLQNDTGTPAPTVTASSGPTTAGGTVTVNADGSFTYNPAIGYTGTDSFNYTVTNSSGSDSATVTITIEAAPKVASTSPANNATVVPANSNITITFSEPVNVTASAFTLECPTGTPIAFTNTTGTGPATSFTLDPASNLPLTTVCTVTVVAAQVSDVDTLDPPDTMAANYSFSFTTTDAAPFVADTTIVSGTTNVPIDATIIITFSEQVNLTANAFELECPTGTPITGTIIGGGKVFGFTPTSDMPADVLCRFTVVASQVTDVDTLDPPDTMAANFVLFFTTEGPPKVSSTTPAVGAANVATDANITVTFNEPVNVTPTAFVLECPAGTPIPFSMNGGPATTFTLNPTSDLPEGVTCTVTVVAAEVSDVDTVDPPDNMAADYVFSFTTDAAPTVTSTTPSNGATNQATDGNITINFSEAVNAAASAFTIECPAGTPVPFSASAGPATIFTLNPTSDLPAGITCTVTVVAAQVHDADTGDPPDTMAANYVFSFSTDDAPSVTSTTPANAAANQATDGDITINFSEAVNVTASAFTLECPTGTPVPFSNTTGTGPTTSFTLNPTSDLPAGETCTVTVVAAQVTDADSNDPPDTMVANYVFTFSTDAAPSVATTTPANLATNQATNGNITITFSEPVNVAAGAFTLECPTGTPVPFSLSGSPATTFTLNPTSDLPDGVTCTVTVVAAQVTDVDPNDPPDAMAANYTFSFSTDSAPSVTSTSPINLATNQTTGGNITITFSEPVNATASAFTLECPTGTPIPFSASASPATIFTLNPTSDLPDGVTCTVTVVAAQVTDVDGNDPPDTMVTNFVFAFSTDAAPSVTSTTPANLATNQATNGNITITFSEPVNVTAGAFTLECPTGTPVPFSVNASPATIFTLNPTSNLPEGVTCTVTVVAAQVTDVDAIDPPDTLAANYVFSFSTDTAPSVTSTTPADAATNVPLNTTITVNFSESVNATTSSFTLDCGGPALSYSLSASPSGSFTLTPAANLPINTLCTITVVAAQIHDVDAGDPPDTLAADEVFTFTTVNQQAPTAVNDGVYAVNAGSTLTIATAAANDLLDNDTLGVPAATLVSFGGGDVGGTVTSNLAGATVALAGGTLTVNGNGSFSLTTPTTPGNYTFLYRLSNVAGTSDGTVSIQVRQPPTAVNDSPYAVNVGSTLTIATTDPNDLLDNDTLGFPAATIASFGGGSLPGTAASNLAGATVALAGGTLTVNANGSFSFTTPTTSGNYTFLYRLSNAGGFSDAIVSIQVRQVPTAVNDSPYAVNVGGTLTIATTDPNDLLDNDTLGFPAATIASFGGGSLPGTAATNPAGATVALAGGTLTVNANGSFSLTTPTTAGNYTFLYRLSNVAGSSDGTVSIQVRQPPTAVNDGLYTVNAGSTLTILTSAANDLLDNDTLGFPAATIASFGGGSLGGAVTTNVAGTGAALAGGTLTVNANGSFTFATPTTGGNYTFLYRLSNAGGFSDATVSIQVQQAPTAVDDTVAPGSSPGATYHTPLNTPLNIPTGPTALLANDTLGTPTAVLASFGAIELAQTGGTFAAPIGTVTTNAAGTTANFGAGGSLIVNANGSLAFTPPTGYTGLFRFQYRITNVVGSDDGTVTLAVGQRLTVTGETYPTTVVGNVPINTTTSSNFSVLSNDTGDGLIAALGTPSNGNVTLNANGTFIFNPTPGYTGAGGFTYTVSNGFGSTTGTLSLTVSGMIWFVDNNAGVNGDGRLGTPFNSLANFVAGAADDPGDNIFLYRQVATNYTGGITLQNNQRLIGQGTTGTTLSALVGLTPPADSPALPTINGTRPVISNAGTVITLGSGNTVRGLNVSATGGTGITGASVGALAISDVTVANTAGIGVSLSGGTLAVTLDSVSSSGGVNGIFLSNNSGSFTSNGGTIDPTTGHGIQVTNTGVGPLNFTLQNSTVTGAPTSFNGVNFDIPTSGSFGTITVKNNTISNNGSTGLRTNIQGTGSIAMIEVASNTFTGNPTGIDLATNGTASVKFDIHNNPTISGSNTQINLAANDAVHFNGVGPTMEGYIRNNTLTSSIAQPSITIWVVSDGDGNITTDINNNTVSGFGQIGISVEARGGTGDVNARIANNTASTTATGAAGVFSGMYLTSSNGATGETSLLCANLISNNINGGPSPLVADYYLDRHTTATTFQIQGLTPASASPAQVQTFVFTTDSAPPATVYAETGPTNYVAATCATVSFAPLPQLATGGEGPDAPGAQVTQAQLDAVATAAIERWAAAGLPAAQLAQLRAATVQVSDLEAGHLGDTFGTQITLDRDAAGWGWFVDATPGDDSEFGTPIAATERHAAQGSPASGRMDLLTVVMHEFGHILGDDDIPSAKQPHDLMTDQLATGARRSPAAIASAARAAQLAVAPAAVTTTAHSVQVDLATLPAGKHVVVSFDVVIANPVPQGVTQVSNQARISGTNFTTLLTDDPATATAADPTVTALDVGKKVYLPLVIKQLSTAPDLVVTSVSLSPNKTSFSAGEPVLLTVVIKNQGNAPTAAFWVDLYLNPAQTPALNKIWNNVCGLNPCYGLAWLVNQPLAPGASLTLTSAVGSYAADFTRWPGGFAAGTTDLYVLADSWNPGLTSGASADQSPSNNLFHLGGLSVTGNNTAALNSAGTLPERPAARGR